LVGVTIVHIPLLFSDDYHEASEVIRRISPIREIVSRCLGLCVPQLFKQLQAKALKRNTFGGIIHVELTPEGLRCQMIATQSRCWTPTEASTHSPAPMYCCCIHACIQPSLSQLSALLSGRKIKNVAVAGFLTHNTVELTMKSGAIALG
jgi:hypothetical protein